MKGTTRRFAGTAAMLIAGASSVPAAAEPADAIRYPYVAALSRVSAGDRVYFCAGTLVAPRWILTAAHCFQSTSGARIPTRGLSAVVGRDAVGRAEEAAQVPVDRVVLFPGYRQGTQANDLALVRLADIAGPLVAEASGSEERPAQAVALGFASFYEGALAARALTSSGAPAAQASDRMRSAHVRFVDPSQCSGPGRSDAGDTLCVTASREAACVGDSGGPLIEETAEGPDRLLGVLSFGTGCAVAEPRIAYTRVAPYARWIAETVAGD
ncbi:MAG TPA: serine protease [Allosphingosinicella sp.]|nr:serine protease [Allosphingosinicella sp.]